MSSYIILFYITQEALSLSRSKQTRREDIQLAIQLATIGQSGNIQDLGISRSRRNILTQDKVSFLCHCKALFFVQLSNKEIVVVLWVFVVATLQLNFAKITVKLDWNCSEIFSLIEASNCSQLARCFGSTNQRVAQNYQFLAHVCVVKCMMDSL